MELSERISVLIQAANLAQAGGILSFDDAVTVKKAIDDLKENNNVGEALATLINVAILGQKRGIYTLQDAHFIYLASSDLENVIPDEEGN